MVETYGGYDNILGAFARSNVVSTSGPGTPRRSTAHQTLGVGVSPLELCGRSDTFANHTLLSPCQGYAYATAMPPSDIADSADPSKDVIEAWHDGLLIR